MAIRRKALLPAAVVLAFFAFLLFLAIGTRRPLAPPPLPVPNGRDDLIRAAELAPEERPSSDAPVEELRGFLEQHREVLAFARTGLTRECRVALEYSKEFFRREAFRSIEMINLSMVFEVEGDLAEREGRLHDALRTYLDLMRLYVEAGRGGISIHRYSTLCTSGLYGLAGVRGRLSPPDRREALRTLLDLQERMEPPEEVIARTQSYLRDLSTPLEQISTYVGEVFEGQSLPTLMRSLNAKLESECSLLIVDLAVRAHRDDRGALPQTLEGLIPTYLPALPRDPFAPGTFHYRVEGDRFVLYGAGEDGKDDGGDRQNDQFLEVERSNPIGPDRGGEEGDR